MVLNPRVSDNIAIDCNPRENIDPLEKKRERESGMRGLVVIWREEREVRTPDEVHVVASLGEPAFHGRVRGRRGRTGYLQVVGFFYLDVFGWGTWRRICWKKGIFVVELRVLVESTFLLFVFCFFYMTAGLIWWQ